MSWRPGGGDRTAVRHLAGREASPTGASLRCKVSKVPVDRTRKTGSGARTEAVARMERSPYRNGSLQQVTPDTLLVPAYADPRRAGDGGVAVLYRQGLLQDRVRPVDVLQPVARRANRQEVGADLREDVTGERKTRRLRQRGGAQPTRHPADLRSVGHRVARGAWPLRFLPCRATR